MVLMVHFLHRHVRDTAVILEEVTPPHPRSPHFDMLVIWGALNCRHTNTAKCAMGEEQKLRCLASENIRESTARDFQYYGRLL